jgi:hypothetical protein
MRIEHAINRLSSAGAAGIAFSTADKSPGKARGWRHCSRPWPAHLGKGGYHVCSHMTEVGSFQGRRMDAPSFVFTSFCPYLPVF